MKRILPLMLVVSLGVTAFGCKSKSTDGKDEKDVNGTEPGANGQTGSGDPAAPATAEELNTNPTEVDPVNPVLDAGEFTDGPVWHAGMKVLFFSTPLGDGALYRMLADGRVLKVRGGNKLQGTTPIGNTVTAKGELVTVEAKQIVRTPAEGGEPAVVAALAAGQPGAFDTLNDVVARKDGTLYVTDPGYFTEPAANRIYRIDPGGNIQVVETFQDVPRPNGVTLSPDERTLYVGFTQPMAGTAPFVRKYIVNDDGTLGEWVKFVDCGPDSFPDGLTVDKAGNVYIATAGGITVVKPNGQQWGKIPIPEKPTGVAFGGEDLKTLFVTTEGTKIWTAKMKLSGVKR